MEEKQNAQKADRRVRVAVFGFGHRAQHLVKMLCSSYPDVFEIRWIYEPFTRLDETSIAEQYPLAMVLHEKWDETFDASVDLAVITTVNKDHVTWLSRFMLPGSPTKIFCEKPIVITKEQWWELFPVSVKADVFSGFVLRHAPFYQKIKELVSTKSIGDIVQIHGEEMLHHGHGAFINQDWRRFEELSGGHIIEKGVHVIDLMIWFVGKEVECVFAQGSNLFWTPANGASIRDWMIGRDPELFRQYVDTGIDPFDSQKDIPAAVVSTMKFKDGILGSLTLNTCAPNSMRRFTIVGTRGVITAHWEESKAEVTVLYQGVGKKQSSGRPAHRESYTFDGVGCHGDGDRHIIDRLAKYAQHEIVAMPSFQEALHSTAAAIAMEESMHCGKEVRVEHF